MIEWLRKICKRRHMNKFDKNRLRAQLRQDEGVVYAVYADSLGYPTFGIGHLIIPSDPEYGKPLGTPVSRERVNEVFEQDLSVAVQDAQSIYQDNFNTWPGEVQEVLINMAFNLGREKLESFVRMHDALDHENWDLAAQEGRDSRWYTQVTNRAERLMTRLENIHE